MVTPWREVEPIPTEFEPATLSALKRIDGLRTAWAESIASASASDLDARRQRSLRSHAIETGIIEQLYNLEWGATETLVAEGLTLEAVASSGISEDVLEVVRAQLNGLEYVASYVGDDRPLSAFFIRQLHETITAGQHTYDAHDT